MRTLEQVVKREVENSCKRLHLSPNEVQVIAIDPIITDTIGKFVSNRMSSVDEREREQTDYWCKHYLEQVCKNQEVEFYFGLYKGRLKLRR